MMQVISVIEDEEVIKKDPQAPGFMGTKGLPAFFLEGQAAAQSHRKDPRIPS